MANDGYKYPPDLISHIRKALADPIFCLMAHGSKLETITDERLLNLIGTVFQVTLDRDEARPLALRASYVTPERMVEIRKNQLQATRIELIELETPIPYTVANASKLAPAMNASRSTMCVRPSDGTEDPTALEIWAIAECGSEWWRHGGKNFGMPHAVSAVSFSPGSLRVHTGTWNLVTVVRGKIQARSLSSDHVTFARDFFLSAEGALSDQILTALKVHPKHPGRDEARWTIEAWYGRFRDQILSSMRRLAHGGTLIVVGS